MAGDFRRRSGRRSTAREFKLRPEQRVLFSQTVGYPADILHLTSKDLLEWKYQSRLKLSSDRVIDACVMQLPDRTWRMWYNNETDQKSIYYADSRDLYVWQDKGKAVGARGEGLMQTKTLMSNGELQFKW